MRAQSSVSSAPGVEILKRRFFDSKGPQVEVRREIPFFRFYFAFACAFVFAWHLGLTLRAPITGDEAYYWLWSKHLAWGYHDHPPLVGWLIAAATLFSNQAFWIRLPALICSFAAALFFYFLSRAFLSDLKKARIALLLFLFLPIFATSSIAVFTDTPLILSWVVTLWAVWKALRDGRYWLPAGIALGSAILSKLIGLFLFSSLAFFFLLNHEARAWLKRREFWGGMIVAVLVSLPVWVWNFRHGFENFVFQAHDHLSIRPPDPMASFLGYLGMQILCVSPVLFVVLVITGVNLVRKSLKGDTASQFLLSFALPIHLFFGVLPFWARVGVHWAAPGYISLLIALFQLPSAKRCLRLSLGVAMGLTVILYVGFAYPKQVARLVLPLERSHPRWRIDSFLSGKGYGEILGYERLSQLVKARLDKIETNDPVFLLTDSYTLSSDLAYYSRKEAYTFLLTGQGGEYARWDDFNKLRGQNALWVSLAPLADKSLEASQLQSAFEQVGKTEPVAIRDGPVTRTFYITWLTRLRAPGLLRSRYSDGVEKR